MSNWHYSVNAFSPASSLGNVESNQKEQRWETSIQTFAIVIMQPWRELIWIIFPLIIDREAREIIELVASVRPSVCPSVCPFVSLSVCPSSTVWTVWPLTLKVRRSKGKTFPNQAKMNRLAVYSYVTRYPHGHARSGLLLQNTCQKRAKYAISRCYDTAHETCHPGPPFQDLTSALIMTEIFHCNA